MPINKKENREMQQLVKDFDKRISAPDFSLKDVLMSFMRMIVNLHKRLLNIERKLKP